MLSFSQEEKKHNIAQQKVLHGEQQVLHMTIGKIDGIYASYK